jgi:hypothetical protein
MAQFNPKEFVYHYRNGKPAYYSYDEELYCGTFPENWVEDCLEGTGPKECGNCAYYGSWNGVFLGYCANCAQYVYNGERGQGFIDIGKECDYNPNVNGPSVFDTYLKGLVPDDVGDKDFMDSAALVNYIDASCNIFEEFLVNVDDKTFEEKYPDIDIDEANAYCDEQCEQDVTYTLDYVGGGCCGSNYDGGYDSY